jgi:hypothetical protein
MMASHRECQPTKRPPTVANPHAEKSLGPIAPSPTVFGAPRNYGDDDALPSSLEDAMAKLEANDNAAQGQGPEPKPEKPNPQELEGEALKVNENTVGGKGPAKSPATPRRG